MSEKKEERKCPFCSCALDGVKHDESGEFSCTKCGSIGRYDGENLIAIDIPGYSMRLVELEKLEKEITEDIELESMRGLKRNLMYLQEKIQERQTVQSEQAFLSNFRLLIDRW